MISLFLDSAAHNLIVALYQDGRLMEYVLETNDNHLSERLLPTIKRVLEKCHIKKEEINELIVVTGPGSFTGIRIGVTIAKTMAWALKISIKTISELEVLATTPTEKQYLVPYIDARREAVYAGVYLKDGSNILEDQYLTIAELKQKLSKIAPKKDLLYLGYEAVFDSYQEPQIDLESLGLKFPQLKIINPHAVNPNYLKRTEAEEKLVHESNS